MPQIRLEQREKEKKKRDSELQESVFLGKWLWILFLLIIPSTVASLLKLDIAENGGSWIESAGQALEWISALAYGSILIKLSKVGTKMCIRDSRTHGGVRGRELVAPSYSIQREDKIIGNGKNKNRIFYKELDLLPILWYNDSAERRIREAMPPALLAQ